MNIVIRADASTHIGNGHIMRCLSLAHALQKQVNHVTFICRELTGNLAQFIKQRGYAVHMLDELLDDAQATRSAILDMDSIDLLIVDHYQLDAEWERQLKPHIRFLMAVDDLANRPHECDLLLDHNYFVSPNRYQSLIPNDCHTLFGPEYSLLRQEFVDKRPQELHVNSQVCRIGICMGGADEDNVTLRILAAIQQCDMPVYVDVIVGLSNPHFHVLCEYTNHFQHIHIHQQPENVAQLLQQCDLVIGAGGTMNWERCCLGLASIVVNIADNQIEVTKQLAQIPALHYLGFYREVSEDAIAQSIQQLCHDHKYRAELANNAYQLVDGMGSQRVAQRCLDLIMQ